MKTQLKLNSVVPHGVGSSSESGAIDFIYSYLLSAYQQDSYRFISINQIGSELNEFVLEENGKHVHVNIRYPVYEDFENKSDFEKNLIRLEIIHSALLRIANEYSKLNVQRLIEIKENILLNKFSFDIEYKTHINIKKPNLIAKIVVNPEINKFNFFCVIEDKGKVLCKIKIYSGLTNMYYFRDFFSIVKWNSDDEIIITGKAKEVKISILINNCEINFTNLTRYEKPPYFEMMKSDVSAKERGTAYNNWLNSQPSEISRVIKENNDTSFYPDSASES